jgi:plastocyanin
MHVSPTVCLRWRGTRRVHLPLIVGAAAAVLAIGAPVRGQTPPSAEIVAVDGVPNAFKTAAGGAPTVTIGSGGSVAFSYPMGAKIHNVRFTGAQPSTCVQTAGTSTAPIPPLPNPPAGPGWSGYCTFEVAGTYPFVCVVHASMTGSVTVEPPAGPPPPPPPTGGPNPPPPPALPAATARPAASGLRIARRQRGATIRGSLQVTKAGSRLLARAFMRRGARQLQVGRQLRPAVGGTRVSFAVKLYVVGRRALRRDRRLVVSVRLSVTPLQGRAYAARRSVVLRSA